MGKIATETDAKKMDHYLFRASGIVSPFMSTPGEKPQDSKVWQKGVKNNYGIAVISKVVLK